MQIKSTRGVQQYEVTAAADALVAQQLRPTIERIRQQLGRGSPNTVAPMLEAWFAALAPRLGVATAHDDPGVPAAVRDATQVLWRSALLLAQSEAAQAVQADKDALVQKEQALAAAQLAVNTAYEQFTQRESLLRGALAHAQAQATDSKERTQQLQAELAHKNTALADTQANLVKSAAALLAAHQHAAEQLQSAIEQREKQQERTVANEYRLLGEVDRARQETKSVQLEKITAAKKHDAAQSQWQETKRQLSQAITDSQDVVATLTEKLATTERQIKDFQNAQSMAADKALQAAKARTRAGAGAGLKTIRTIRTNRPIG